MATRPYGSGQIRLSLVSVPVNIYAAVNSARTVPLHEIYRKTGERVHHQLVAANKVIDREAMSITRLSDLVSAPSSLIFIMKLS